MNLIQDGQYNIGHICTRQQCDAGLADKVALRWISASLERCDFTFGELETQTNRFANALLGLGVQPGDVVFTFLPKMPEQFIAFLAALKIQAVVGTLFANFGEHALRDRLGDARAKVLITKQSLLRKISPIRAQLSLKHLIVVDAEKGLAPDLLSYAALVRSASPVFRSPPTPPETPSVLHYTSGSTGQPKGVLHVHRSIETQSQTTREVLGLGPSDLFWCTADQGWVTGTSYGIIGPWSLGVSQVHFGGGFDPKTWFTLLEREKVNVWYSAPTALRMLMREDPSLYQGFNLSALRHIFSVGEPLNPEVISWGRRVLGRDIYDTWFQTETGGIMIANRPGQPLQPGAMGRPVAGIEASIRTEEGQPQPDGQAGQLCLREGWPAMFVTYLNHAPAYREKLKESWYYTGDMAVRDAEGWFWFKGRADDVINTAGHLISPFEIESALLEVHGIAEAGVIGAPDELLFEKVVAFISLKPGCVWTPELELTARLHLSNKVSSVATPQEIRVLESIPKNKSGKIMRRLLKAQYLGRDLGDTSMLEP